MHQSREHLNTLMGLWGQQTTWHIDRRLPDIPEQPLPFDGLETRALRQSIDVASARQRILVAGEQVGAMRATALVPELSLGAAGEREDGAWEVGPVFAFPFLCSIRGRHVSGAPWRNCAGPSRSTTRWACACAPRSVRCASGYKEPRTGRCTIATSCCHLRERIVNETQLQYNAMQRGVFELLRAREQQIQAAVAYIDTLRDYWLARTDLGQILSGRLPTSNSFATDRMEQPKNMGANAEPLMRKDVSMAKSISRRHMLCLTAATVGGSTALVGGTHARATEQPGRSRRPAGTQPAQMPPAEPGKDYTPVITPNGWTLPYKLMNGVKVFHLIAEPVQHEFAPGWCATAGDTTAPRPVRPSRSWRGPGARLRHQSPARAHEPSTGTASCCPTAWTVWRG